MLSDWSLDRCILVYLKHLILLLDAPSWNVPVKVLGEKEAIRAVGTRGSQSSFVREPSRKVFKLR
tara:strand:+ start:163 stop:357 length:195 start_codon:yes stop_codon:yes gene_type:complete